jgi:hypothetical protein
MARKKKAHELTTEEAMRRLFPKKVREELKREARLAEEKASKSTTKRKPT